MGTKNNPGKYDCYVKAEPDEPLFTVLGRDPLGADFVALWAAMRAKADHGARRIFERMLERSNTVPYRPGQGDKIAEAVNVSCEMRVFRKARLERRS